MLVMYGEIVYICIINQSMSLRASVHASVCQNDQDGGKTQQISLLFDAKGDAATYR